MNLGRLMRKLSDFFNPSKLFMWAYFIFIAFPIALLLMAAQIVVSLIGSMLEFFKGPKGPRQA